MTDTEKMQQATQLAVQAAIEQRNAALNTVIDLRVELTLVRAELTELKAAQEKQQP